MFYPFWCPTLDLRCQPLTLTQSLHFMSLNKLESVVSTDAWIILCMDSIQLGCDHTDSYCVSVDFAGKYRMVTINMFCSFICQSYRCWSTKSLNYWTLSSRNLMICFLGCRMYLVVVVTKDHQAWHEVAAQKIQLVSASFHTPKS